MPDTGAALLAALAMVVVLLVVTWRLARGALHERRQTARMLSESESVLLHLAENVREVFYLCDWPADGVFFVSPAFARVFGRSISDTFRFRVGNPASFRRQWIDDIDERDRDRVLRRWEHHAARGGFDVEYRITRGDGEERWLHDRAFPVFARNGRVVRIAGIAEDVTSARLAQRELARQRDALEIANQELARTHSEFDQFASAASHDLQELLHTLVPFAELLRADLGADVTERTARDFDFITDAARRMRTLLSDLLAFSRTATSEMNVGPVSLDDCVDRALEVLDRRICETRAVIARDPLPEVSGDPTLLEELYRHLVSNALKFIAPGASPRVHLSAEPGPGDTWVLGVRDEGIGIDLERVSEIFRPFRRLHSADEYPGTGIGLAIARKAVDRHRGRIWVEAAKEGGSHFRFTLNVLQSAEMLD